MGTQVQSGDTLVSMVQDLARRVANLETSPGNNHSTISAGQTTVLDSSGNTRVVMGLQADGTYGLEVFNSSGSLVWSSNNASSSLAVLAAGVTSTPLVSTSSTSYVELCQLGAGIQPKTVSVYVYCSPTGGTMKAQLIDQSGAGLQIAQVTGILTAGYVLLQGTADTTGGLPRKYVINIACQTASSALGRLDSPAVLY